MHVAWSLPNGMQRSQSGTVLPIYSVDFRRLKCIEKFLRPGRNESFTSVRRLWALGDGLKTWAIYVGQQSVPRSTTECTAHFGKYALPMGQSLDSVLDTSDAAF